MTPTTILTLALVIGAVLGTFSRIWASPSFSTWSKQLTVEIVGNGLTALVIPYLSALPFIGESLDISKLPPIAAGAVMYFIASGSGDFLGNIRRKLIGGNGPAKPGG